MLLITGQLNVFRRPAWRRPSLCQEPLGGTLDDVYGILGAAISPSGGPLCGKTTNPKQQLIEDK